MTKFKGFFSEWELTRSSANSKGRELWIANGFMFFRDEGKPCLRGFSLSERYRLWRELKAEIRKRNIGGRQ